MTYLDFADSDIQDQTYRSRQVQIRYACKYKYPDSFVPAPVF